MSEFLGFGLLVAYNIYFFIMGILHTNGRILKSNKFIKSMFSFGMYDGYDNSDFVCKYLKISGQTIFLTILIFDCMTYCVYTFIPEFFTFDKYFPVITILIIGSMVAQVISQKITRRKIINLAKKTNEPLLVDIGNKKLKKIIKPLYEFGFIVGLVCILFKEELNYLTCLYTVFPLIYFYEISNRPINTEKTYIIVLRGLYLIAILCMFLKGLIIVEVISNFSGVISGISLCVMTLFIVLQIKVLVENSDFLNSLYPSQNSEKDKYIIKITLLGSSSFITLIIGTVSMLMIFKGEPTALFQVALITISVLCLSLSIFTGLKARKIYRVYKKFSVVGYTSET